MIIPTQGQRRIVHSYIDSCAHYSSLQHIDPLPRSLPPPTMLRKESNCSLAHSCRQAHQASCAKFSYCSVLSKYDNGAYFFPVSVAQHPQNKEAGQQTTCHWSISIQMYDPGKTLCAGLTARTIATPKPRVGPTTLQ